MSSISNTITRIRMVGQKKCLAVWLDQIGARWLVGCKKLLLEKGGGAKSRGRTTFWRELRHDRTYFFFFPHWGQSLFWAARRKCAALRGATESYWETHSLQDSDFDTCFGFGFGFGFDLFPVSLCFYSLFLYFVFVFYFRSWISVRMK